MDSFLSQNTKSGLQALDHEVIRVLKDIGIEDVSVLVAVSGGLDSVVLLHSLNKVSKLFQLQIFVSYIHHGWIYGEQGNYRDKAWSFVKKQAEALGRPYYSNLLEIKPEYRFLSEPEQTLKSEQELRDFRHQCLSQIMSQLEISTGKSTYLALAHTANDLLETRLIRLIRGTGLGGIQAMSVRDGNKLRPLLGMDRSALENYLRMNKLSHIEDPSNSSTEALRNWLRKDWLPQLEVKRPGSVTTLSRSLELLSEEKNTQSNLEFSCLTGDGISHPQFLELLPKQKQQVIAVYLRLLGLKNYGAGHIKEILKRLDSQQKEHTFSVLKHEWSVNTKRIKASPV